jgi:hypothetical protein
MNITSLSYAGAQAVQAQPHSSDQTRAAKANPNTDNSGSTADAGGTTPPANNSSSTAPPNTAQQAGNSNAQQGSNPTANAAAGIGTNLDISA